VSPLNNRNGVEGDDTTTGSRSTSRLSTRFPLSVSSGQAMVDIDAIVTDAERVQSVALGGEILLLC
jgi:hypothetical protein